MTGLGANYQVYKSNPQQWRGLEASLYCVRSVARLIDRTESEFLPQVCLFVRLLRTTPKLFCCLLVFVIAIVIIIVAVDLTTMR
jgi:hypothetical protein